MKKFHRLLLGYALALLPCLTSCGLIDMDFDAETQQVTSISFVYDTVYVMERDTFFLAPYFYPDTTLNKTVAWEAEDATIVHCLGDTIVADTVGTTNVIVTTLLNHRSDTCLVNVIPRWDITNYMYPHDMIVYARIQFAGKVPPKQMIFAAFCRDEIRGLGEAVNEDRTLYRFRVWSMYENPTASPEEIEFRAYDPRTLQLYYFTYTLNFDGETHGLGSDRVFLINNQAL